MYSFQENFVFSYVSAYDYMLKIVVDFDGKIFGQFSLLLSNFYSL